MSVLALHAVFDVNPESRYRKDFWRRYDIPNKSAAEKARENIGHWIIFRRTGTGGYVAVACVDDVIPDIGRPGFSVALISGYLPFTSPVPFSVSGRYAEQQLRLIGRRIRVGQAVQGKPIRELWPSDFNDITLAGFAQTVKFSGNEIAVAREPTGFEEQAGVIWDYEPAPRAIQELFVRRAFRDANFRLEVCGKYGYKCAFTRVSITDGSLFEVDAAHTWSVKEDGPDIVQNGLCASKTLHWAFDHYLISVDEAYCPLVAPRAIPDEYLRLFPPPGDTIHLPKHVSDWPAKVFLDHHRALFRRKHGL